MGKLGLFLLMSVEKLSGLRLCFVCFATLLFLGACGDQASNTTETSTASLTPAERCNSAAFPNWELRRRCLNLSYQDLVDECHDDHTEDEAKRTNCLQWVRYRFNLHESGDYYWDQRSWANYDRRLDPYYSLDSYNRTDLWRRYYDQALLQQNLQYYRLLWNSSGHSVFLY